MIMRLTNLNGDETRVVASAISFWESIKDDSGQTVTRIFFDQYLTVVRETVSEVERLYYQAMGTAMPEMTKIDGAVVEKLEKTATADSSFAANHFENIAQGHSHT